MSLWDYAPLVKDHYLNPRNVGTLEDADAVGTAADSGQGRVVKLYLKFDACQQCITQAMFQSFGCPDAVASASALTELLPGKTIAEANDLGVEDLRQFLGQVPEETGDKTIKCLRALGDALKTVQ